MNYYLINNKIMKGKKMPLHVYSDHPNWYDSKMYLNSKDYLDWLSSLQPCEISESELDKIIKNRLNLLSITQETYISNNPIDVTDIISDNNGVITFKHPKQVDGEIEAIEFAEWLHLNCSTDGETNWRYHSRAGNLYTTKQLYEIFKNRKP